MKINKRRRALAQLRWKPEKMDFWHLFCERGDMVPPGYVEREQNTPSEEETSSSRFNDRNDRWLTGNQKSQDLSMQQSISIEAFGNLAISMPQRVGEILGFASLSHDRFAIIVAP